MGLYHTIKKMKELSLSYILFNPTYILYTRRGDTIICIWVHIPQLVPGGGASIIRVILNRWMSPNYYGPDK